MGLRESYQRAIESLPIINPKRKDIRAIMPHLRYKLAMNELNEKENFVALPALKVRETYHIVQLIKGPDGKRILEYVGTHTASDQIKKYVFGVEEALAYAKINWGYEMVSRSWQDATEFQLRNPTIPELQNGIQSPKVMDRLFVTLNRDLSDLLHDNSEPRKNVFDEAIGIVTRSEVVFKEFKTFNPFDRPFANCFNCWSSLKLTCCKYCGVGFSNNVTYREDGPELPSKIIRFLRAG